MITILYLLRWRDILLAIGIICISGCNETELQSSGIAADGVQVLLTLDVGEIRLDAGTVIVTRTFEVNNNTNRQIIIDDVRQSCSCVSWELGNRDLAPGEATSIEVSLKVDKPGRNGQSVWMMSQETLFKQVDMVATGVYQQEFSIIVDSFGIDPETLQILVNLYVSDSGGHEEAETPVILEPKDVKIAVFGTWLTIERKEPESGRPTRQVASVALDFRRYQGKYPVDLIMKTSGGSIAKLSIQAPWKP